MNERGRAEREGKRTEKIDVKLRKRTAEAAAAAQAWGFYTSHTQRAERETSEARQGAEREWGDVCTAREVDKTFCFS